jgi:hypothetical protein
VAAIQIETAVVRPSTRCSISWAEDDTCSDESDARDKSLNHASHSVGTRARHRGHDHDSYRATEADQRVRAIDTEDGAGQNGAAKPSRKFDRFQVRHALVKTCYR